jgi:hypothetical protein
MAKKKIARKTTNKTASAAKRRPRKADQIDAALKSLGKSAVKSKAQKPAVKKMSALDAAAKVLATAKEPMTTGELIEAMAAHRYWKSPGGQTADRTLYSAITREIKTKGKDSCCRRQRGRGPTEAIRESLGP